MQAVEFYLIDGHEFTAKEELVSRVGAPPYAAELRNLNPGAYRVFARAVDDRGLATDSDQVHVQVERSTPGPRLTIQWMGRQLLMVTWDAPGAVLETTEKLPGEWRALPNASSPHHVLPSERAQYFRLRLAPAQ